MVASLHLHLTQEEVPLPMPGEALLASIHTAELNVGHLVTVRFQASSCQSLRCLQPPLIKDN